MRFESVRSFLRGHGIDRTAAAVGAVALAVYAVGVTWGLPHATNALQIRGWDVDGVAGIGILSEFHNLLVDPKEDWYTAYPLLHYLVLGMLYAPYLAYLALTGGFSSPSPDYPFGFADPVGSLASLGLLARLLTITMAAATVAITYAIGSTLWNRRGGLVAAAVLGLSTPMVYYARTSNLDVPVLFWSALGMLVIVRSRDTLSVGRAVAIGVLSAFAVGTKDQAYGAFVPAVLFVLVRHARSVHPVWDRRSILAPLVMVGTGLVAFLGANGVFVRPSRLARHLSFITSFEETFPNLLAENGLTVVRETSATGLAALVGDLARAASAGMSPVLLLTGLAGAVVVWRFHPSARVLLWMLVGFVVLTLFPLHHIQYRYTLFPVLVLSLCTAAITVRGSTWGAMLGAGLLVIVGAGVGWEVLRAVDLTHQMRADARYAASEWLEQELVPGDSIGYFGAMHQLPHLPAGTVPVPLDGSPNDGSAVEGWTDYIIVAPDYYADATRVRSGLLEPGIYGRLVDGSLGYRRVALFRTDPLTAYPAYLPYVNPQVQVFRRERSG